MGGIYEPPRYQSFDGAGSDQREALGRAIAGRTQEIDTLANGELVLAQKELFSKWRRQSLVRIEAATVEIRTLNSTNINLGREFHAMQFQHEHLTRLKSQREKEFLALRRLRGTSMYSTVELTATLRDLTVKRDGLLQSKIKLEREIQTIYPGCPEDFGALETDTRSLSARLKELETQRESLKQQNGFIQNNIKKLSVDNLELQRHLGALDREIRDLRQPTQAQRTETRTSQNTQGLDDKVARNTELANDPRLECSICLSPLTDGPVSVTPCRHRFHTECIKALIEQNSDPPIPTSWWWPASAAAVKVSRCPMCRSDIPGVSSLTPQAQWIQQNRQDTLFSQFAVYIDK